MKQFLAASALAVVLSAAASAHHSYAGYDRCKTVTIAGEIERISWANPHVVFTLKVDDTRSYLVQWESPNRLKREDVTVSALNVGDRVTVTGSAHRDPDVRIVTLITAVRRPNDGWEWLERAAASERCAS